MPAAAVGAVGGLVGTGGGRRGGREGSDEGKDAPTGLDDPRRGSIRPRGSPRMRSGRRGGRKTLTLALIP